MHYSKERPSCSTFRVITANILGVRIFRKFTVCFGTDIRYEQTVQTQIFQEQSDQVYTILPFLLHLLDTLLYTKINYSRNFRCPNIDVPIFTIFEPAHEIWHFLSTVNSFFKYACAVIQVGWISDFWSDPSSTSYVMCANSEGSGETARMRRLAWAFTDHLCDKYHNLMSWLIYGTLQYLGPSKTK